MTILLWCLLITALLPFSLAFWGNAVRSRQQGGMDNHHPRQQYAKLSGRGARLWAAQQNAWEALGLFTAAVVACVASGASGGLLGILGVVFVLARIAHGVCYALDLAMLRSAIFGVALLAVLGLFGVALL